MQELDQGYKREISVYLFKYCPFSYQIYISEDSVILSTKPSHVLLTSFTILKKKYFKYIVDSVAEDMVTPKEILRSMRLFTYVRELNHGSVVSI